MVIRIIMVVINVSHFLHYEESGVSRNKSKIKLFFFHLVQVNKKLYSINLKEGHIEILRKVSNYNPCLLHLPISIKLIESK